jgi:hypothetical protein
MFTALTTHCVYDHHPTKGPFGGMIDHDTKCEHYPSQLPETHCSAYKDLVHKNIRRGPRSMCDGEVCAPFRQT